MKRKFNLVVLLAFLCIAANAQEIKFPALDPSPADIVYFPLNFSNKPKKGENTAPLIKVIYSRPSAKGRVIFGTLEAYGKVWRVGANENTEIRFFKPATVGGKKIPVGTYSLFAIPNADKWIIIINKQTDRWGAYVYDETLDVARVEVPVKPLSSPLENLSITFTTQPSGANLIIGWDKVMVEVPVAIK